MGRSHARPALLNLRLQLPGFEEIERTLGPVEQAATFWNDEGRQSYERFGITATTTEQHVWYDHPDSERRWPLPRPTGHPAPADP